MWKLVLFLFLHFSLSLTQETYTPIVLWHGVGDTCCNPNSLGRIITLLEEELPGVYVHSLKIGSTTVEDFLSGYLPHPDTQVDYACKVIKENPLLSNGYHALGFSQGSQLLRAIAQRCPEPKMKTLVSLGGQQQGVYGIPRCHWSFCELLADLLNPLPNNEHILKFSVQANYWHDAKNQTAYEKRNSFLVDINNEKDINEEYVKNLQSLENIVFVMFEHDKMVIPRESQWFGFYKPNQAKEIQSLQESKVYDRLGLRQMDAAGKLHFISTPGEHLQFSLDCFIEEIVDKFFK